MFSKTLTLASGLIAAASLARATGTATIVNYCDYPVYLWVADSPAYPEMQTIQPGGSYSEGYKVNPDGGGVSMKVAKVPNDGAGTDITQFEYTMDGTLWYDLSAINGNPFFAEGQSLRSNNPGCQSIKCKPSSSCNSAYYEPDDNAATHACDQNSDTTLRLCTHGAWNGDNSAGYSDIANESQHHRHHKHHHKHHHKQIGAPAPQVATTMVVVTTTQVVKREADPTPVADSHLGARHAHNYHIQHRHGLSH